MLNGVGVRLWNLSPCSKNECPRSLRGKARNAAGQGFVMTDGHPHTALVGYLRGYLNAASRVSSVSPASPVLNWAAGQGPLERSTVRVRTLSPTRPSVFNFNFSSEASWWGLIQMTVSEERPMTYAKMKGLVSFLSGKDIKFKCLK